MQNGTHHRPALLEKTVLTHHVFRLLKRRDPRGSTLPGIPDGRPRRRRPHVAPRRTAHRQRRRPRTADPPGPDTPSANCTRPSATTPPQEPPAAPRRRGRPPARRDGAVVARTVGRRRSAADILTAATARALVAARFSASLATELARREAVRPRRRGQRRELRRPVRLRRRPRVRGRRERRWRVLFWCSGSHGSSSGSGIAATVRAGPGAGLLGSNRARAWHRRYRSRYRRR